MGIIRRHQGACPGGNGPRHDFVTLLQDDGGRVGGQLRPRSVPRTLGHRRSGLRQAVSGGESWRPRTESLVRILMVSDVYFPRVNGVSTSIQTFRREFRKEGHEVILIAPEYGQSPAEEAGVIRIRSRHVFADPEDRMMEARSVGALALQLERQRFDILHIQTPFIAHYAGIPLARRLGVPVVETYHTLFEEYLQHYAPFVPAFALRRAVRSLSRRQCSRAHAVVVPSQAMRDRLASYGVRTAHLEVDSDRH
jgi:glycosyltransferase involved in cell wall biosynthesis